MQELPDDLGAELWRAFRAVTLWAQTPPDGRSGLFHPLPARGRRGEAPVHGLPDELARALDAVDAVLDRPGTADQGEVGAACLQIAQWAADQDRPRTEYEFLHATAAVLAADPTVTLRMARAARDRAAYAEAESWYERAVGLARRAGDWDTYSRAYIGLGKTYTARGALPAARRSYQRAVRASRRRALHDPHGMALHDLFTIESYSGNDAQALQCASEAARVYGAGHRLLPSLAYDLAYFWLNRGEFEVAYALLRVLAPQIPLARRLRVQGAMARAAAATGDAGTYHAEAEAVGSTPDDAPGKADALCEVARGAEHLGDWEAAERTAEHARQIAVARGEAQAVFEAESILSAARAGRAAASRDRPEPDSAPDRPTPLTVAEEPIVRELLSLLEASQAD